MTIIYDAQSNELISPDFRFCFTIFLCISLFSPTLKAVNQKFVLIRKQLQKV